MTSCLSHADVCYIDDVITFFRYRTFWLSAVSESDAARPVGFGAAHSCHAWAASSSSTIRVLTEAATVKLYEDGTVRSVNFSFLLIFSCFICFCFGDFNESSGALCSTFMLCGLPVSTRQSNADMCTPNNV